MIDKALDNGTNQASDLLRIAEESNRGKRTHFLKKAGNGEIMPVYMDELRESVELGENEQQRQRILREECKDWRRLAEKLALALLNKEAIEATVAGWQERYDAVCEQLDKTDRLVRTFQDQLQANQKTMGAALRGQYGSGSTDAPQPAVGRASECER